MEIVYFSREKGNPHPSSLLPAQLFSLPFTVLATHYQCLLLPERPPSPIIPENSLFKNMSLLVRNEGFLALGRGFLPLIAGTAILRDLSNGYTYGVGFKLPSTPEAEVKAFASSAPVGVAIFAAMEVLRVGTILGFIRRSSTESSFSSYGDALRGLKQLFGLRGVFCGLVPCALRVAAMNAVLRLREPDPNRSAQTGFIYAALLVLYPLQVIQTQMIAQLLAGRRRGMAATWVQLLHTHGSRAFYRGLLPYSLACLVLSVEASDEH